MRSKLKDINCLFSVIFILFLLVQLYNSRVFLKNIISFFLEDFGSTAFQFDHEQIENNFNEQFSLKNNYININGLVCRLLGEQEINQVYRLSNGHLTQTVSEISLVELQQKAEQMEELSRYVEGCGSSFLYVQAPYKIDKYSPNLPCGVEDYSNKNADIFIQNLNNKNIQFIDLRESLYKDGITTYEMFLPTDHHWSPLGGFYAYQEICKYMDKNLNIPVNHEYLDINNYIIETYPDWSLGSWGKRTGRFFGGLENIDLIYPRFHTDMSMEILESNIYKTGEFKDVIFDYSRMFYDEKGERPSNIKLFDIYSYYVYTGSNYGRVVHYNHLVDASPKVLLIKESFALPTEAFLSSIIQEMHVLDMRYYNEGSIKEYIKYTLPDLVIFMLNPDSLKRDVYFSYD